MAALGGINFNYKFLPNRAVISEMSDARTRKDVVRWAYFFFKDMCVKTFRSVCEH